MKIKHALGGVGIGLALLAVSAIGPATASAQTAPTKIGKISVYDYTWMSDGYTLMGSLRSKSKECRKVKRTVILKNATQGKKLGRGAWDPLSRGYVIETRPVAGLVRKGDRIKVTVHRRKAGKVLCASASKTMRVKKVVRGGAG